MLHTTSRAFGGFSSSTMGRHPYVQADRRRPRTPLLLLQLLPPPSSSLQPGDADNRNPAAPFLSSARSREEKDSSLPYLSRRPTNTVAPRPEQPRRRHHHHHHHHHHRQQLQNQQRQRQARRLCLFSTAGALSALTHRAAALNMLSRRRMLQAHSSLLHHLKAVMALLQPLIARAPSRHDEKLVPRVVAAAAAAAAGRRRATLPERIPRGAWDSHMHVVDPAAYPLAKDAVYCPKTHRLDQALSFEASVGIDNIVLVQPSIYGNDNACLLDALRALGPRRGRAVVAFEPGSVPEGTRREWHRLGVRGVRINLSSVGRSLGAAELEALLRRYAEDCRPLDWVIQVYMPMAMIELLEPIVPTLGVRVCVDHLGHPCVKDMPSRDPYAMKGFASLARLLRAGATYVKLSAPYRLSARADHGDLEPIAREVLRLRGRDRVIFATDWPHTRFEGLDIRPWMETVLDWCGKDDALVDRLFRGNAEDLWNTRGRA